MRDSCEWGRLALNINLKWVLMGIELVWHWIGSTFSRPCVNHVEPKVSHKS